MAKYYPIMLNLTGLPCLVVGGGEVAERKVVSLLECDAELTVISPQLTPKINSLSEQGKIRWLPREFQPGDAQGHVLVISATDQAVTNHRVAAECRAAGIIVNVVDDPKFCSFVVPAVVRQEDLVIAVSTGGSSPLVARQIRDEMAQRYGPEYGEYLRILAQAREKVLRDIPEQENRRNVFEQLTNGYLLALISAGQIAEAKEWVEKCLSLR
ncbi:MAG TPA: bifunctional precorrin-2 dehydrogenase/sirohydrochlorin ferrochelatase [Desulfobacteria bacterium]|nr:bifunctional precorrin-2 dehydrogenase/sirohydrochlorin ferrochelatase [Desulfobacteria bacterium]